jgi:hypothetical protein
MFVAATIGEWRGHDVVVAQGHKIGGLEAVCVDTRTGLPSFGTVKAGTPIRHRLVLVPVDRAAVGSGVPQGLLRQEASEGCPVERHRWRVASGRRRGDL